MNLETQQMLEKFKSNCTQPAISDFPSLVIPGGKFGAVVIPILITIYLYLLLTAVCENYFVTSINILCSKLGLNEDVAGATLLAAASSSPEFFINVIGTFVTRGDIGVGAVVGSALFNILAVPALCGLFAAKVIKLNPWPLLRDSFTYGLAVIVLFVVMLDGRVEWYEALSFILLYFLYITGMYWNKPLQKYFEFVYSKLQNDETEQLMSSQSDENDGTPADKREQLYEDGSQVSQILAWSNDASPINKSYYILTLPITVLLAHTIPDCRTISRKDLYVITFVLCIVWIAVITYMIAWMITIVGSTLNIPDSVLGLTFIAVGMSLPEAAVSVIIARQGDVTMAISNSLGSNTFDVLLCLGIPWLLKSTCFSTPGANFVLINSRGIGYSSSFLIVVLICLLFTLYINKFQLDKQIGCLFLFMYIFFITLSVILETNVFSVGNLPVCPVVPPL